MSPRPARAAGPVHPGDGPWVAIVGTRPNYVKVAPLVRAAAARGRTLEWIQTGQHTSHALSKAMARDLAMPAPISTLRASPAGPDRIADLTRRLCAAYRRLRPSLVVAVGDVDSTCAGAYAASQMDIPLVHVEAGLRCFDPDMPEERNRIAVDHLSDRLYLTEPVAQAHLQAEGIPLSRMRRPGNVMADALRQARGSIDAAAASLEGLPGPDFGVVTLHRQGNVDDPKRLASFSAALCATARNLPLVFPVHPRTAARLQRAGGRRKLKQAGVRLEAPMPYLSFLGLISRAGVVITDSGGLQVEAALLGTPCVTARDVTEHPITVELGANRLSGADPRRIPETVRLALSGEGRHSRLPRAWDGRASTRIVDDLCKGFVRRPRAEGPSEGPLPRA